MSAIPASPAYTLHDLVDWRVRLHQHALGLVAVVFLAIYGRLVCPFINGLKLDELLLNLGLVFVAQVAIKEVLMQRYASPPNWRSLPRQGYLVSIATWIICGILAMALHFVRYADFPLASHVKLMSGYWIIGGGLLAQWEYVLLEGEARKRSVRYANAAHYVERITRRVMEGFILFSLVPSFAMALTMARYKYEGLVDRGMVIEISFLGGFCVLLALGVSLRFGRSLRDDAQSMLEGTQKIERGEKDVVLDSSRMDELGAVACGVNGMYRELEAGKTRLEKQLVEKDAVSGVALAMSSLMPVDTILDMIVENAKVVTKAEASSLLLIDEVTGGLRFHVAKGEAAKELANVIIPLGKGIVGAVAATGSPLLIEDAYADPRFDRSNDERTGFRTRQLITVPMMSKGVTIGVVQAINKAGGELFGVDDLRLLESFAAQAAVSLENARLLDRTRRMADDLRVALENERNLSIEKQKMGAYIPKSVMDDISKNREQKLALGGKTMLATVLFSDIKGFTALSERLDPQATVGFLNVYMTAMTAIVEEEGGVVDKFMGDGIMAVFAGGNPAKHATAAVRAGVRMQSQLAEMRKQPGLTGLQMRVGINTGDVVAGNIGSETRMDYTVIGDNVNVASRLEGKCMPDCVLVSASTWLWVKGDFRSESQAEIRVKNRDEPILTYLINPAGPLFG
jgi:class 3 adenylate cyclase